MLTWKRIITPGFRLTWIKGCSLRNFYSSTVTLLQNFRIKRCNCAILSIPSNRIYKNKIVSGEEQRMYKEGDEGSVLVEDLKEIAS